MQLEAVRVAWVATIISIHLYEEGVVTQWCNPLTLQPEQSGGVGLRCGWASPLEHHDKGSQT